MNCNLETNKTNCTCTYTSCSRRGACCQCLAYHLPKQQLPGCCFPAEAEQTYDRSFRAFAQAWKL